MLSEDCVVEDAYDVVFIIFVFVLEIAKKAQLYARLVLKSLLVSNDFDCDHHARLVVETLKRLAETARTKLLEHFESVRQVVFQDDLVVASFVVKAKVVSQERRGFDFGRVETQKVHFRVVLNLNLLIVSHSLVLEELEGLAT